MLAPVLELTMVPTAENQRYESPWYSKGSNRAATCSQGPDITPFYLLRHSKTSPSPPNLPFLNVSVRQLGRSRVILGLWGDAEFMLRCYLLPSYGKLPPSQVSEKTLQRKKCKGCRIF